MVKPKQLGHLVLRVRDVEASEKWYQDILGLHTTNKMAGRMVFMSANDQSSHELALMQLGPDAPGPESDRVGLYHFAWEMESFDTLKALYQHIKAKNVNIGGIGDHGISIGVYLFDPDGNEIEIFYETPRDQWPKDGKLFAGKFDGGSLEDQAVSASA